VLLFQVAASRSIKHWSTRECSSGELAAILISLCIEHGAIRKQKQKMNKNAKKINEHIQDRRQRCVIKCNGSREVERTIHLFKLRILFTNEKTKTKFDLRFRFFKFKIKYRWASKTQIIIRNKKVS